MALMPGFRRFFRRPPPEVQQDVDAELDMHLEMKARELIDDGLEPEDAQLEARRRFGNLASIRRQCIATQSRIARIAARSDWLGIKNRQSGARSSIRPACGSRRCARADARPRRRQL